MAVSGRPWVDNSWRISHLGAKPVRGGSPARDKRIKGNSEASKGTLAQETASLLMLVEASKFSPINIDKVIVR